MLRICVLLTLLTITFSSCCGEDETEKTNLSLNFKATFGTDPFVLYQDYTAPNGHLFEMRVFNFFLSDITLTNEKGEEILVADHTYVNFNAVVDQNAASQGVTLNFTDIPIGNYKKIRFGIGVSPDLNAKDPSAFGTASALGNTGNYWTAWNSYIFSRFEGEIDTLPNDPAGQISFLYHAGGDGMYQEVFFDKDISLNAQQENTIFFSMNAANFFYKTASEIDIPNLSVSHSGAPQTDAYNVSKEVIINLANAIAIQ